MNIRDLLIATSVLGTMIALTVGSFGFGSSYGYRKGFETGLQTNNVAVDSEKLSSE